MENATPSVDLLCDHPRALAQAFWHSPIGPEFTSTRLLDSLPNRGPASPEPPRRPRSRWPGAVRSWLRQHPQLCTQDAVARRWGDRFCPPVLPSPSLGPAPGIPCVHEQQRRAPRPVFSTPTAPDAERRTGGTSVDVPAGDRSTSPVHRLVAGSAVRAPPATRGFARAGARTRRKPARGRPGGPRVPRVPARGPASG